MFTKKPVFAAAMLAVGLGTMSVPAHASTEPYIGQIMPTGFDYCPRNWAQASGQLLPINQNQALFSLLGTTFGGNGQTTFALPNLNGRMPIGSGQGPGLPNYVEGQSGGTMTIQLTAANLPSHTHTARMRAVSGAGNIDTPLRNSFATTPAGANIYSTGTPNTTLRDGSVNIVAAGEGQAISNVTPSIVMKYCIALSGIFPSRP